MKEIDRIKKHLERAYAEVSKLKVSGDVVDTVYEIREELRQAYRVATGMERDDPTSSDSASPSHLPRPAGKASEGKDRGEEVNAGATAENEV